MRSKQPQNLDSEKMKMNNKTN